MKLKLQDSLEKNYMLNNKNYNKNSIKRWNTTKYFFDNKKKK